MIDWAGEQLGRRLPREYCARHIGAKKDPVCTDVPEWLVSQVWLSPQLIRPCIDLLASELHGGKILIIDVYVAGYSPKEFSRNWTGRMGPYVFGLNEQLRRQVERQPEKAG